MGPFCCHGTQSFDPICSKTLCSLSPSPVMLHIKFDQDWPSGLRDIQVQKCGWLVGCGLTSQSTIFQSYRDGAIASWVINQYFRGVKCLAQGHNTAAVGLEPRTSRSGVRHSTTEPPRSLKSVDDDDDGRRMDSRPLVYFRYRWAKTEWWLGTYWYSSFICLSSISVMLICSSRCLILSSRCSWVSSPNNAFFIPLRENPPCCFPCCCRTEQLLLEKWDCIWSIMDTNI